MKVSADSRTARLSNVVAATLFAFIATAPTSLRAQDAACACLEHPPPVAASDTNQALPGPASGITRPPSFFTKAAEHGVFFNLYFDEEVAGNPSGGIRQGIAPSQYVTFGGDIDLERLVGWKGASLHAIVIAEKSEGVSQKYIGGGVDVQENFSPFDFARFLNFTIEQDIELWQGAKVNLLAGRMSVTPTFAFSQLTCLFVNHAFCGVLYGLPESTGAAPAPLSTWGGRMKLNLTPKLYFQFGGFAVDTNAFSSGTEILDWGTGGIVGVDYLGEAGYETTFANDPTPRFYRIGFSYTDAPRSDVFLNQQRLPLVTNGGNPLLHHGQTAIYAIGGQVLWREDVESHRNLAAVGSIYYNFADSEAISYTLKGELVKTGTFRTRSSDTLDLGISLISFSTKEVDLLTALRHRAGGAGRVPSKEIVLELNYGYQLASGVVLRPNLQYIIQPDPRYTPTFPRDIPNAFVIGIQITASIDRLFGLPHIGDKNL